MKKYTVYLAGEIHSNWREEIIKSATNEKLPIDFLFPEENHEASDKVGEEIITKEEKQFWYDRRSAGINSIRIATGIKKADIVVVRFGEKYKQWNAAFDAGYAHALGKKIIVIHPEEFNHALKEIDAAADATVSDNQQVFEILKYLCR